MKQTCLFILHDYIWNITQFVLLQQLQKHKKQTTKQHVLKVKVKVNV